MTAMISTDWTDEDQKRPVFEKIALDHFTIETLETRKNDSLDFHDCAVWSIRSALDAAFEAGREAAKVIESAQEDARR